MSKTNFSVLPGILQEVFLLNSLSLPVVLLLACGQAVPGVRGAPTPREPRESRLLTGSPITSLLWNAQHPGNIQKEEKT